MEFCIKELDNKTRLVKEALNRVIEENNVISKQKHLMQSHLSILGVKLNEQRSITSINSNKLESRSADLLRANDFKQILQLQLQKLTKENLSQVERNQQLEEICKEVEKSYNIIKKDTEKLKMMLSTQTNEYKELCEKADLQMTEIKHRRTSSSTLDRKMKEIEILILRHQEILYNSRYSLVKVMRKIAKYEGEEDLNLKEKLVARIRELESILKEKTDTYSLITAQVKHSENDLRRISVEVEKGTVELQRLMDGRQDRMMAVEGGQKKLLTLKEINQQLQVEQNILQLQISQVEKNVGKHEDTVYSLERQHLELEAAMSERRTEIQAQKDILFAKKKTLQEEKSELKRTVEHLNTKISQAQKRYEIAIDMLGNNVSDGEENSFSITQCKIKIAQEKSELQEKGDSLDAIIRKSEKEILSMENTLRLINSTNDNYKLNLCSIDEDSPEMAEKHDLEQQYLSVLSAIKRHRNILRNIVNSVKELEKSLMATVEMEEKLQAEWKVKDKEARDLDKELGEQQIKLNRAEKQLSKISRIVHRMTDCTIPFKLAEKDIETRELQDINNSAINQLAEIASQYIESAPVINRYLNEKGLSLSHLRRSRVKSWRASSVLSLTPSGLSDLTYGSPSTISVSEHSSPSIVNLDPFAIEPAATVKTSVSIGRRTGVKSKKSSSYSQHLQ